MRKVLLVCCDGFENGGIQAVIMNIVRGLHPNVDFDAIVFSEGNQFYSEEFQKYGVIHHFPSPWKGKRLVTNFDEFTRDIRYTAELRKFLKKNGPYDVIHCHNYFESAPFLKVAAEFNIPVRIAHSHNVAPPYKRKNLLYNLLERYHKKIIKDNATHLLACSKEAGRYLFDNAKTIVVHNAIDLDRFNPQRYKIKVKKMLFSHVGRYCDQKNQLFLLDVFKRIHDKYPESRLKLVGFGKLERQVSEKIRLLELDDCVEMLASNSNIPEIFAESEAMIFPSTYEGLGISLIEAQAMGVKCYVSEAIQPEANLGLCKMIRLDAGSERWAELICEDLVKSKHNKTYVDMSSYSLDKIIDEYRTIYSL